MANMSKSDVLSAVADAAGCSKTEAEAAIEGFFGAVVNAAQGGDSARAITPQPGRGNAVHAMARVRIQSHSCVGAIPANRQDERGALRQHDVARGNGAGNEECGRSALHGIDWDGESAARDQRVDPREASETTGCVQRKEEAVAGDY